jgi:hypothetical protein|tara:strand:+ start:1681 stop:2091 length:411 start_codon:yes stop_codon:yes gene_type:complete
MKKSTVEKLNKVIDVTGDLIPVERIKKEKAPVVATNKSDLTDDYDFSRNQYHTLIEKGNEALEELLAVAKESESARAYEVTAQLVRTLSDTTKELLELQKTLKDIEKDVKDPQTVNNSLFIGSTKELQDLLQGKKK